MTSELRAGQVTLRLLFRSSWKSETNKKEKHFHEYRISKGLDGRVL